MTLYNLLENMINKIRSNASQTEVQSAELIRLESMINNVHNTVYPVGSIYMSVNSVSPAQLFGGTWEQIENRFLFGASDTILPGTIAGEAEHTLTETEMPKHKHAPTTKTAEAETNNAYYFSLIRDLNSTSTARRLVARGEDLYVIAADPTASDFGSSKDVNTCEYTAETGGSQSHNNMPPYLAVYIWKRMA